MLYLHSFWMLYFMNALLYLRMLYFQSKECFERGSGGDGDEGLWDMDLNGLMGTVHTRIHSYVYLGRLEHKHLGDELDFGSTNT